MMAFSPASPTQSVDPAQSETLDCRVDDLDDGVSPSRDTWLTLFEHSQCSRVYHHPDYFQAVCPQLGVAGFSVFCTRGTARRPVGAAILIPKRCQFGRQLLPGARRTSVGLRLVGNGLLGAEDPNVVERLVREVAGELVRRRIRVVEFEELPEDSELWRQLQRLSKQGFRFAPAEAFDVHHRSRLCETADDYWQTFRGRHRQRWRRERNRFGDHFLKRYTHPDEIDEWLVAAHEISRNSWQSGQLGLRIRNDNVERRYLTFLTMLGAWRSYILFRENQPAAFVLGHQWKGVYHYDEVAFDRRLLKLYPGKVMLQELLTDLMSHDRAQVFDFGLGDAQYKREFATEQFRSATLWMFPPGTRGRWQAASVSGRRRMGRLVRSMIEKTPYYNSLRSTWRNVAAKLTTAATSDDRDCPE